MCRLWHSFHPNMEKCEPAWWRGYQTRFEGSIWHRTKRVSVRMASDASDNGLAGHTMQGVVEHAHEYFSQEESGESSTFRELLGVFRCLQAMISLCKGKFVVFQVDAQKTFGNCE